MKSCNLRVSVRLEQKLKQLQQKIKEKYGIVISLVSLTELLALKINPNSTLEELKNLKLM